MKKLISLAILLLIFPAAPGFGQPLRMRPADHITVDLFSDIWKNTPEGMDTKTINRGISVSLLYDLPLGRTNFTLAAGGAITSHNLYSNQSYKYNSMLARYDFAGLTHDYSKNKLSLNYFDIPVQLRYRSRDLPHVFRIYAGIRAGYLINAHTKYTGQMAYPPPAHSSSSYDVIRDGKYKEHRLGNIEKFRAGFTGLLGYGQANLHVYVPLMPVFTDNNASDMEAISVGVSFILF